VKQQRPCSDDSLGRSLARQLTDVKCPTLVVAASNDAAVPLHHVKMLHDGITGSQFVIIDGANHAPIWARPDKLVRVINELLES
jgi:3-oxoadipate enol-lactonase